MRTILLAAAAATLGFAAVAHSASPAEAITAPIASTCRKRHISVS